MFNLPKSASNILRDTLLVKQKKNDLARVSSWIESEASHPKLEVTLTPTCLLSHLVPYLQNVPTLLVLASGNKFEAPIGFFCYLYTLRHGQDKTRGETGDRGLKDPQIPEVT